MANVFIGTAGWSISTVNKPSFEAAGSQLASYASRLNAVEINSAFYRPHRPSTYAKWADTVGDDFRFSVKIAKAITHERRLQEADELLDAYLEGVTLLGPKLGVLLVQLPPSLALERQSASDFFAHFRSKYAGRIAVEARHPTWFSLSGDNLFSRYDLCRVFADPSVEERETPTDFCYLRLHGRPEMYYSNYELEALDRFAQKLNTELSAGRDAYCIFDNTAAGHALLNALEMRRRLPQISAVGATLGQLL